MKCRSVIERFEGEAFVVLVERSPADGEIAVRVMSMTGVGDLTLFEMRCSPEGAKELGQLLRPAAALATHLAAGGCVEHWSAAKS